jgi:histidinol dehydrogenase
MTAFHVVVAGVKRIIMTTPLLKNMNDTVLFSAKLCGIKEIYCVVGIMFSLRNKNIKENWCVGCRDPGNAYEIKPKGRFWAHRHRFHLPAGSTKVVIFTDKGVPSDYGCC